MFTALRALGSRRSTLDYGLALAFFALGLMSKPTVVTLPCVLLLLDYWPLARWPRENLRRLLWEKAPFVLLAAGVSGVTYIVQKRGGMMTDLAGLPWSARGENALVSYGRYLAKLFWPADLCPHYVHPIYWPAGTVWWAGVLVVGLSGFAYRRRRCQPYWLIGWLWYLGTLVPMIGLVQVGTQSMADRYTYIPSLGILPALVWGASELTRRWRYQVAGLAVMGGMVLLVCIGLTRQQVGYWQDGVTLWGHAVAVENDNYSAHDILGRALFAQGRNNEAIHEFQESLRLKPDHAAAEARYYLGGIFMRQGRVDEAIDQYQKAMEIQHPNLALAHSKLGQAFSRKGQLDDAILHYQKALEIQPLFATAHNNLGHVLLLKGRLDEALVHLQKAAELEPSALASHNLGSALFRMGRVDEALGQFRRAVRLNPAWSYAHHGLGVALRKQGRLDESICEFQEALRLQPDLVVASNDLAVTVQLKESLAKPPAAATQP